MRRKHCATLLVTLAAVWLGACAAPSGQRMGSAGENTQTVTNPNPPGSTTFPSTATYPTTTYPPATAPAPGPVVTNPGAAGTGAAVGGAVGAGAGALIDKNNRWRGALVGGAVGAVLGGTVNEIRSRATREAAAENRPVAYETEDRWQRVEAYPQPASSPRGCRQVQERVYQNGQLVQETIREVCS